MLQENNATMSTTIQTINPVNNAILKTYNLLEPSDFGAVLEASRKGYEVWRTMPLQERCNYILRIADEIDRNIHKYAMIATQEMGKPVQQSIAELKKSAMSLRYYAENAVAFLHPDQIPSENKNSFVSYQPLGTVMAIMPWNFPYWQVFRVMAPVLLGGNAMLLKHASNVTGCSLAIQEIVEHAGLPSGVFQSLVVRASQTEQLIAHPYVQAVTFTGSTEVGKQIAATAGRYLKKQVLELGGSDAYIVCEDADLHLAAAALAKSRMNNAGQSCIAAKRFIVMDSVVKPFLELLRAAMEAYEMGNPEDDACNLGAMARPDLRDELHRQVQASVAKGAKIAMGGYIPEHEGAYYPPTILTQVTKGMPAYHEEFFGPVAIVITAATVAEAISIANDTAYGLGGGIFSSNEAKAMELAEQCIEAGTVNINSCVVSNPKLPFGGIKESGYGRELSRNGLMEFVNIKTVVTN